MVEQKEIVTLFKIEKLKEEIEELIPIEVIEGTYDEKTYTFESVNGDIYTHIEETAYPNIGFARKQEINTSAKTKEEIKEEIDLLKKDKLELDCLYKYIRFLPELDRIFIKGNNLESTYILADECSKKFHDQEKQVAQFDEELDDEYDDENLEIEIESTPKEIEESVKETIKGQDEAIRTISTAIWLSYNKRKLSKKQMILIGPTGVGKTAIFKKIQKILEVPVVVFSVPGLSQAGYVGRGTDEILRQVYYECEEEIYLAEHAIVILDEIDKLASANSRGDASVSTIGVQNELLKIVEGDQRLLEVSDETGRKSFVMDTSKMIFIATGAFQELYTKEEAPKTVGFTKTEEKTVTKRTKITSDDIINYGLKPELVGRFPIIVELNKLDKDILKEIILSSDESELLTHIEVLNEMDIEIANIDETIDLIVEDAFAKNIGARGLVSTISRLFQEIFYEVINNPDKYSKVTIGKNILNDIRDFTLEERNVKKRVRNIG